MTEEERLTCENGHGREAGCAMGTEGCVWWAGAVDTAADWQEGK